MCDGTGLTPKLKAAGGGGGGGLASASAPIVSVRQLQRPEFQKDFMVIDVREKSELGQSENKEGDASIVKNKFADIEYRNVPMGQLLSSAFQVTDEFSKIMTERPKIALMCGSGPRAQLTANDLIAKTNYDVYNLKGGFKAVKSDKKFVTDDDWCAILSYLNNDAEKVGIALNLCNAAAAKGKSVTLVLMHEAVYLGTKRYNEAATNESVSTKDETWELPKQVDLPKPFKVWKVLFDALISKKGQILVCTSCMKKRGISPQNDLIDAAVAIRGPDIIDITSDAGFVMQFM